MSTESSLSLNLTLCHGSGNRFVMLGRGDAPLPLPEADFAPFTRAVCSSADLEIDGVLFVLPDATPEVAGQMRMFNPDGSEAEMCGNGLRCVAREVMTRLGTDHALLSTLSRRHPARHEPDMVPDVFTVSVEMGSPDFDPAASGIAADGPVVDTLMPALSETRQLTAAAIPNPHLVALVDTISLDELTQVGQRANAADSPLTQGGNVNFVQVLDRSQIYVATYERGVGLTASCGSGMTASAIVASRLGAVDSGRITVLNQGGFVYVDVAGAAENFVATLAGNVTFERLVEAVWTPAARSVDVRLGPQSSEPDAYRRVEAEATSRYSL